jgi:hypothetical protein
MFLVLVWQGLFLVLASGVVVGVLTALLFATSRNLEVNTEPAPPAPRLRELIEAILLFYIQNSTISSSGFFFTLLGFPPETAAWIFPSIYFLASAVAWHIGYLPSSAQSPFFVVMYAHTHALLYTKKQGSTEDLQPKLPRAIGNQYQYKQLGSKRSIRVLTLNPASSLDAPLECTLSEASLDNPPDYLALSYAWDSFEGTASVVCDGSRLEVTKNCARALQRIRKQTETRTLWVDAICIDQGTTTAALAERTQQILIMGEVYKRAQFVVVWVGSHDRYSESVCQFLESVGSPLLSGKTAERVALRQAGTWVVFLDKWGEFFRRSWFTRMWPIQEVTLPDPRKVALVCGDSVLPFSAIRTCWQVLNRLSLLPISVDLDQSVALQFYLSDALALKRGYPGVFRHGKPMITDLSQLSLRSIIKATRFKSCAVAKDKFFALLSIFDELEIPHTIDASRYAELTEVEVFTAVLESCVAIDSNLDAVSMAQSANGYANHDEFWRTPQETYETWSNILSQAFRRVRRLVAAHGAVGSAPAWRKQLPSWVPDLTQWIPSRKSGGDDIVFIQSYASVSLWARLRGRDRRSATPQTPKTLANAKLPIHISGDGRSILQVRAKVVGLVRSTGSVDSLDLFWQWIAMVLNFYLLKRPDPLNNPAPFFQSVPDACVVAVIETVRNYINVSLSRVTMSFQSMWRTTNFKPLLSFYSTAAWAAWRLRSPIKRVICSSFPSGSACPSDSPASTSRLAWIITGGMFVFDVVLPLLFLLFEERQPVIKALSFVCRALWEMTRAALVFSLCLSIWDFRAPIISAYCQVQYDELPPFFAFYGTLGLIRHPTTMVIVAIEDAVLLFCSQVAIAVLEALIVIVGFQSLWFGPTGVLFQSVVIFTLMHGFRCGHGTAVQILGSDMFVPWEESSSGKTLFCTQSGITGNTSGPVELFDLVVLVEGVGSPMIMRGRGDELEVVSEAYVGNMERESLERLPGEWETVCIR